MAITRRLGAGSGSGSGSGEGNQDGLVAPGVIGQMSTDELDARIHEILHDEDLIVAIRWLSDVEGCFFTCSCPADQRVRCALNLLRLGAKDWWSLTTGSYSDAQRATVTWDQFQEMFNTRYAPRVERERERGWLRSSWS
uniref:Retrotransposon gag domain-containing protein n=1 Tax=Lactuca sativa TaxID=4236 RepID=A0A9R1VQ45_LACSA|nr:hypothetical protein LSAT_V11C400157280 [Lactuca sativa]